MPLKFTLFTPTYNRESHLTNLYKSLLKQDYSNFEWIIVDDGSIDGTKTIVNSWINERKLHIKYFHTENGGKHRAYNIGIENADSDLFICIDSDDIYESFALKEITEHWQDIEQKNNFAGITYLSKYNNGEIIGTEFPEGILDSNHFEIYFKHKVKGDKGITLRTDLLKQNLFPEFKDENFVTESVLFHRLSRCYKTRYINTAYEVKEYLSEGLSSNYRGLILRNPLGTALYYKECIGFRQSLRNKIRHRIYYARYSIVAGLGFFEIINQCDNKISVSILYPVAALYAYKDK